MPKRSPNYPPNATCSVDGCSRPNYCKLLCTLHYTRQKKHGSALWLPPILGLCNIEGCYRKATSKGWCDVHDMRLRKHGSFDVVKTAWDTRPRGEVLFWAKVDKNGPNGCWLWLGKLSKKGYGGYSYNSKHSSPHRYSYELHKGAIPEGLTVDHLCRVRHCVNPDHLEVVTNEENVLRGFGWGANNARKTHCIHGHELSGPNLYKSPNSIQRFCRTCISLRNKKHKAKKKLVNIKTDA